MASPHYRPTSVNHPKSSSTVLLKQFQIDYVSYSYSQSENKFFGESQYKNVILIIFLNDINEAENINFWAATDQDCERIKTIYTLRGKRKKELAQSDIIDNSLILLPEKSFNYEMPTIKIY